MDDSFDVDPLEGSVGREEVAVVHAGRRRNNEVGLGNQRNGPDLGQRRVDLENKVDRWVKKLLLLDDTKRDILLESYLKKYPLEWF